MNQYPSEPTTNPEVWPEETGVAEPPASNSHLPDEADEALPPGTPEWEEEPVRAVPRAGIGDPEAWQEHHDQMQPSRDDGEVAAFSPSDEASAATDLALPDPATVPELAPLVAPPVDSSTLTTSSNGDGPPPTEYSDGSGDDDFDETEGAQQDLWSHLGELRSRLLHSIIGVLVASVITWNLGEQISEFFARPIRQTLEKNKVVGSMVTLDPMEGFIVYFQITLVSAVLLAAPWILFQGWRFIEPALTKSERRTSMIMVPFSVILFFSGCALGYGMSPLFFQWFLAFQPPGTVATFSYGTSVVLLAKMLLAFGICFQVPVITIFLHKIGLVSRGFLIDHWRHAVIIIFLIAAVATPTWDPLSLAVCAVPPCLLYGLSIWMVKWL